MAIQVMSPQDAAWFADKPGLLADLYLGTELPLLSTGILDMPIPDEPWEPDWPEDPEPPRPPTPGGHPRPGPLQPRPNVPSPPPTP
ncbi:hypothetical protein QBC46DRAFT_342933 [Diplogelasinospora grovesii]|uniref:Uncharacterized protein n=1 Tax=Diplogelasinospora grovesii TaxID=303347 RepID=A0AAN6N5X2_9PEZI|nr:hypothetical protein QBC46DRAFT_342933 [Diplogelasinospora grovesii]